MILSTHFITGAALASFSDSVVILFCSALILHFVLDAIPHWEYLDEFDEIKQKWPLVAIDILLGPSLILFSIVGLYGFDWLKIWPFLFSGAVSVLPDGLSFLHFMLPQNRLLEKVFVFHEFVHNKKNLSFKQGFLFQIVINLVFLLAIFLLPKG